MRTSLFWYTKDLRVDDMPGLAAVCEMSDVVIPVYVWDDQHLEDEADNRKAFLLECLVNLDEELRKLTSGLRIERGDTIRSLVTVCKEYNSTDVYCTESGDPAARRLQNSASLALHSNAITLQALGANFLLDPDAVKTRTGGVYKVFTPFRSASRKDLKLRPSLPPLSKLIAKVERSQLPQINLADLSPDRQKGGIEAALYTWSKFKSKALNVYHESRNDLANENGTSRLSAHLNFGTISVQAVYRELSELEDSQGKTSFINELMWREFNSYIAHHFPSVLHRAFREELSLIEWPGKPEHLVAWKEGMTGYPVVDAAMRQLKQTGWMHNRARMIVASFLVKDLLINWQEGEAHFMEWLTDGDQVQNNAGWQWSASTGVDAQPYFRIFNPITQSKKFDPNGEYIRRYIPELRNRPDSLIHQINVRDGSGYPMAIVDHATQRERALEMFKQAMTNFRK